MAAPDMDVIKEIPGYKVILKAVIKSQIQQLVEQLASTTDEESVILTASVADGTLCHLGSDSGKVFLEDHEDIKSQFLGFCLKRHHKKQVEKERQEAQEREEALARSMQAVTPPRYSPSGPRFMSQRSPRYPPPRQQGIHPVALSQGPAGPLRSPANRHQPYPMARPLRHSLNFEQNKSQRQSQGALKLPVEGQVIKIEPDDDDENSNQSANVQTPSTSASQPQDSSRPSSPSAKPSTPAQSQGPGTSENDDARSDTSSSTIPNEATDLKLSESVPTTGLNLDSDLSSLTDAAGLDTSVHSQAESQDSGSEPHTQEKLDPNVSVKVEGGDDSEMDLEITGVELGQRPPQQELSSQEWLASVQNVMQGAAGTSADMGDQQSYNARSSHTVYTARSYSCPECGKQFSQQTNMRRHVRIIHQGKKPFGCEVCGRMFSTKANLQSHYLVHMNSGDSSASPR